MNTRDSTSTSITVESQRLEMDFEGIRSSRAKRSSEPLILEYTMRKCREDNERIVHTQEQIMNDL